MNRKARSPKVAPPDFVLYVRDALTPLGPVDCRRLFGGWGFWLEGKMFAACLREKLYFCADEPFRQVLADAGGVPFAYSRRDRDVTVERFYSAPDECLDDPESLREWAERVIAAQRT